MTTYFVGSGGSNANNGLTWATRKLTLNGAEDVPVVAGDTVIVGPGSYRETLTVDVSGTAGNPITYIADVTGEQTDGVGGIVRITGSDDDQSATRGNAIAWAVARSFRTFRGFLLDTTTSDIISSANLAGNSNIIIEDCVFQTPSAASGACFRIANNSTDFLIRRCFFLGIMGSSLIFSHTSTVDNTKHIVENCIFLGSRGNAGVEILRIGGITIRQCTFIGNTGGVRVTTAAAAGQTTNVTNCIFQGNGTAFIGTATTDITENFNTLFGNTTARTNTNTGANSVAYPALFSPPMFLAGFLYPWIMGELSQYSQIRRITGAGIYGDDLFGFLRPETHAKRSWGAIQATDWEREIGTVRTGTASVKLADAGRHQMFVPTANESTTFSVYVRWEADYAGTKPQMVIKQPNGVTLRTVTATGAHSTWEQISATLTPAALPPYVIVEFVSNNTASSGLYGGNFDVFFDDFDVS